MDEFLTAAIAEAEAGRAEGGIPIGAALFDTRGMLLGRGHNRRIQEGDPSIHAETDAFRKAGKTILFVTHSMPDIQRHCTRVLYMEKGEIVAEGEPAEVIARRGLPPR